MSIAGNNLTANQLYDQIHGHMEIGEVFEVNQNLLAERATITRLLTRWTPGTADYELLRYSPTRVVLRRIR